MTKHCSRCNATENVNWFRFFGWPNYDQVEALLCETCVGDVKLQLIDLAQDMLIDLAQDILYLEPGGEPLGSAKMCAELRRELFDAYKQAIAACSEDDAIHPFETAAVRAIQDRCPHRWANDLPAFRDGVCMICDKRKGAK